MTVFSTQITKVTFIKSQRIVKLKLETLSTTLKALIRKEQRKEHKFACGWRARWDLNPGPPAPQAGVIIRTRRRAQRLSLKTKEQSNKYFVCSYLTLNSMSFVNV